MLAIPAVDIRDGQCVQLVGGDYQQEVVRLDDPSQVARQWANAGFTRLHVVDLDAATGRGENYGVVRDVLGATSLPVQVGGGVRDDEMISRLLSDGAERVVVGTRGVEDPAWLAEQAVRFPGRIILAADVKERRVVTHGWSANTERDILDLLSELEPIALAGVLVTAVHMEGRMQGTDLSLMEDVVQSAVWPVIASGGVASMLDLRNLEERGVSAVVLGMALYTGALDPRMVAEEFCA